MYMMFFEAETGVPYYAADCVNEDTVKALCDYLYGTA